MRTLFVLLALLLGAGPVSAATYFVSKSGNDANSCGTATSPTQTNQKRTIPAGLSCLTAGDTLSIHSGTYTELLFEVSFGGSGVSWSNFITVAAVAGETVTLAVQSGGDNALRFQDGSISYVVIDGIVIDGSAGGSAGGAGSAPVSFGPTSHHIRLRNIEIAHAQGNGVIAGGTAHEFLNLNVHGSGEYTGYLVSNGMYLYTDSALVSGGRFWDNECYGVRFMDSDVAASADNNTVKGASLYNNGAGIGLGGTSVCGSSGGGVVLSDVNNVAYNNLVYGNVVGLTAFSGSKTATQTKFYNNTVYNNAAGIQIFAGSQSASVINNIVYATGTAIDDSGTATTANHNLLTDPSFVGTGTDVFALQSTSTARDTGATIALVTTDILGVARPVGGLYDIGAYEYNAVTPPVGTRLAWDEPDTDLTTVQAYVYTLYVDARPGVVLVATCSGSSSPFPCEAPLPRLQPGVRALVLIASNANGMGVSADALSYTSTTGLIPIIDHNRKQQR